MFSVGDMVMYGGTGVCAVEDITMLRLSGMASERAYYLLRPLYSSGTIQIPVDSIKVPIRPVLTKAQAEKLVDDMPSVTATICTEKNLSALRNHYQQQMSSFDCRDLVRMTKSIYAKKKEAERNQKKIGMTDEKFLRRAEDLLYGELAVALGISRDAVGDYIADRLAAVSVD